MRPSAGFHGRRIQKTGGSTFIVSLPKSWVTDRGLAAGDILQFVPRSDGSLGVFPEGGKAVGNLRRLIEIDNDIPAEHLFRRLVAEYIAGVPLLELHVRGRMAPPTREVIRNFAQRMIGPEILEETADSVILQDVIGPNPLPIPQVIRRMHQMAQAMLGDAMTAFATLDDTLALDVMERDWEVDRLHWFVGKQVTSALRDSRTLASLGLTLPDCTTYLLASRTLERIADHAVRIAGTVQLLGRQRVPESQLEELRRIAEVASGALRDALDSLERKDIEKANEVLDTTARVTAERAKLLEEIGTKRGKLAVGLAYVLESLERSAFYASDLAEIAINHAVETSG